jgi:type III secretory pathway component EscR
MAMGMTQVNPLTLKIPLCYLYRGTLFAAGWSSVAQVDVNIR